MKPVLIIWMMATAIVIIFTSIPVNADFNWENNITVYRYNMTWEYTEQYTGEDFVLYKCYIDSDIGNDDGYISAWELFKFDPITRKSFYDSIIDNMDVRINGSSGAVHLQEIDSSLSESLLGRIYGRGEATNHYRIMYSFDGGLTELGTSIWFLAEPESNVTITFPGGIDITSTGGIENTTAIITTTTTTTMQNSTTMLIGTVGFEGEVTIGYAENATWILPALEPIGNVTPMEDAEAELSEPREPYDPIGEMLKKLGCTQNINLN